MQVAAFNVLPSVQKRKYSFHCNVICKRASTCADIMDLMLLHCSACKNVKSKGRPRARHVLVNKNTW